MKLALPPSSQCSWPGGCAVSCCSSCCRSAGTASGSCSTSTTRSTHRLLRPSTSNRGGAALHRARAGRWRDVQAAWPPTARRAAPPCPAGRWRCAHAPRMLRARVLAHWCEADNSRCCRARALCGRCLQGRCWAGRWSWERQVVWGCVQHAGSASGLLAAQSAGAQARRQRRHDPTVSGRRDDHMKCWQQRLQQRAHHRHSLLLLHNTARMHGQHGCRRRRSRDAPALLHAGVRQLHLHHTGPPARPQECVNDHRRVGVDHQRAPRPQRPQAP